MTVEIVGIGIKILWQNLAILALEKYLYGHHMVLMETSAFELAFTAAPLFCGLPLKLANKREAKLWRALVP